MFRRNLLGFGLCPGLDVFFALSLELFLDPPEPSLQAGDSSAFPHTRDAPAPSSSSWSFVGLSSSLLY